MKGETISHYRVLEKLGAGGMGVVYAAEDLKLGRKVALKFLASEYSRDPVALYRFEREARAASALNHPNICTIYEIDEFNGDRFIAMELLKGQTLRDRVLSGTIPIGQLIEFAIQIASGLEAAHSEGIIHRDIKPANIFVTTHGYVKILDFGLAKLSVARKGMQETLAGDTLPEDAREDLTMPGAAVGTLVYMSPEQALGEPSDLRTDLFSFGAVLYEMATGKQAFKGNTSAATVDAILHKAPLPVARFNPKAPSELQAIINKALEKDANLRYQTASDMRTDLLRVRRDTHISATWDVRSDESTQTLPSAGPPPAPPSKAAERPPATRSKKALALAAGVLAIVVAVGVGWWWRVSTRAGAAAHLKIQADPGALVVIDDKASGTVGPDGTTTVQVSPGDHSLQLTLKELEPYSTSITLKGGEWKTLAVEMKPVPPPPPPAVKHGSLLVQSNIEAADILINGQLKGVTEQGDVTRIPLDAGTYKIQLKKPGYYDSPEQPVEILAGKESQTTFKLMASKAPSQVAAESYLTVKSRPGAEIRVDRKMSGSAAADGIFSVKADPGTHLVEAFLSGYEPFSSEVRVKGGGRTYFVVDLKPSPPVINSFVASQSRISEGQTVNLKWAIVNASEVRIDPAIGAVSLSGTHDVTPGKTTTYVLTAKGAGGSATAKVTVTVGPDPADVQAITETMARFKGAYDSLDINAIRREWPTLPQTQADAMKTTFLGLASVRLSDDCEGSPAIHGDTAEWTCVETVKYVPKDRQQIPEVHNTVIYRFKRAGGRWYVDRREGAHNVKPATAPTSG